MDSTHYRHNHGRPPLASSGSGKLHRQQDNASAFGVPTTPPQTRTKRFTFEHQQPTGPVFPLIQSTRHVVCEHSLEPWTYLMGIPGKNVRDQLIDAFGIWIPCRSDEMALVKQIVGYLHSASLIVDDIEDESLTRRGFSSAHVKYGIAPSLNASNYVYFLALEKVMKLQVPSAVEAYCEEMLNLHRGQGRDIYWRTNNVVPSQDEYLQMIEDKTGGLFRLAIRMMESVQERKSSMSEHSLDSLSDDPDFKRNTLIKLTNKLSRYFQIRDDLLNLASPTFHAKKGFCEDITEGKYSFMVLHCMRENPATVNELVGLLAKKTVAVDEIKRALTIMHATGSFDYTSTYLQELHDSLLNDVVALGDNFSLRKVLIALNSELDDCRDVRGKVIDATT